jgi:flagellar L-ring protein precursor FlgH
MFIRPSHCRSQLALALFLACLGWHHNNLTAASLLNAQTLADGTLYSDQVARKIGDLITIQVVESTTVQDTATTALSRASDVESAVTLVPGSDRLPPSPGASDTLPGIAWESAKDFSGSGSYNRQGRLTTAITGRVIDVLENGNLLIEGRRTVSYNNEDKTVIVVGICRTADIATDNSILSEKLHNFEVAIEGDGPLTRAQQEGWLTRLFDTVWPL